jgi:copper chaperone CopZ
LKEIRIMEQLTLEVPGMYADHHVLKVRAALAPLDGIEEAYASSAWKQVMISYDPERTDPATIQGALAEAGYPVDGNEPQVLVQRDSVRRDPRWNELAVRVTETNEADLKMSGEFRRY